MIKLIDRNGNFEESNSKDTIIVNDKKYKIDLKYIASNCGELNFILFNDMINKNEVPEINFSNTCDKVIEIYFDSNVCKIQKNRIIAAK